MEDIKDLLLYVQQQEEEEDDRWAEQLVSLILKENFIKYLKFTGGNKNEKI